MKLDGEGCKRSMHYRLETLEQSQRLLEDKNQENLSQNGQP